MRVVIADDLPLLREGLSRLLDSKGFRVVESVADSDAALSSIVANKPDVAVVDVRLAPTYTDGGLHAVIDARREVPGQAAVVIAAHVELEHVRALLAEGSGGIGYLLKDRLFQGLKLLDAMRHVAAGGVVIDSEIIAQVLALRSAPNDPVNMLAPREREILALLAEGRTTTDIATEVFATEKSVIDYTAAIFGTLGLDQPESDVDRALVLMKYLDG